MKGEFNDLIADYAVAYYVTIGEAVNKYYFKEMKQSLLPNDLDLREDKHEKL